MNLSMYMYILFLCIISPFTHWLIRIFYLGFTLYYCETIIIHDESKESAYIKVSFCNHIKKRLYQYTVFLVKNINLLYFDCLLNNIFFSNRQDLYDQISYTTVSMKVTMFSDLMMFFIFKQPF